MGKRWGFVCLLAVVFVLFLTSALAHKNPIVKYTYVGHIWEEAYTTIPLQPVVNEKIIIKTTVAHPNEIIEGNITGQLAVYRDDTVFEWYGGESFKRPDWLLIEEDWLQPTDNEFTTDIIIGEPGSYRVFVDWYENHQYIGQSMHVLDVETRTLGPLFLVFSALIIIGVLIGVRTGVLA